MEIEDDFPLHPFTGNKRVNTIELPASIEKKVEEFKAFYDSEVNTVLSYFQGIENDPMVSTKDFFVQCWTTAQLMTDWKQEVQRIVNEKQLHREKGTIEVDKALLWETIQYDITEPLALEFRKRKANMAKSIVTFVKMLAAAGFLAGIAYSLYLFGVDFSF
ncbi:MAG: hypothetical protein K2Q22_13455 [Cytophagales bacterium]|nr:hypothetical protein [Cytophagales bacterium]